MPSQKLLVVFWCSALLEKLPVVFLVPTPLSETAGSFSCAHQKLLVPNLTDDSKRQTYT